MKPEGLNGRARDPELTNSQLEGRSLHSKIPVRLFQRRRPPQDDSGTSNPRFDSRGFADGIGKLMAKKARTTL